MVSTKNIIGMRFRTFLVLRRNKATYDLPEGQDPDVHFEGGSTTTKGFKHLQKGDQGLAMQRCEAVRDRQRTGHYEASTLRRSNAATLLAERIS